MHLIEQEGDVRTIKGEHTYQLVQRKQSGPQCKQHKINDCGFYENEIFSPLAS